MAEYGSKGVVRGSEALEGAFAESIHSVYISEGLTEVPRSILERAPGVRLLDLSGNRLTALPEWFSALTHLEVLFLSFNCFSEVPDILGRLPSLRMLGMRGNQIERLSGAALSSSLTWLTLTDNLLATLPPELGALPRLQKLLLAGNCLCELPETLRGARFLELIRLSSNRFESFPSWLFQQPALAWAAIAGNPCTTRVSSARKSHSEISWNQLVLGNELGRGASGQTFNATLTNADGTSEQVALKMFASSVSSDGNATDEISAAVEAGRHPHLVAARGSLVGHPEGRRGLVLDLVPSSFKGLAKPPSLESCTRDVYAEGEMFSCERLLSCASGIAEAARHLHERGILHGDLYAHNTLVSGNNALVSDFGAACIYTDNPALSHGLLERVEVRAFGILLTELLMRVSGEFPCGILQSLEVLADHCTVADVEARPCFEDICARLKVAAAS